MFAVFPRWWINVCRLIFSQTGPGVGNVAPFQQPSRGELANLHPDVGGLVPGLRAADDFDLQLYLAMATRTPLQIALNVETTFSGKVKTQRAMPSAN